MDSTICSFNFASHNLTYGTLFGPAFLGITLPWLRGLTALGEHPKACFSYIPPHPSHPPLLLSTLQTQFYSQSCRRLIPTWMLLIPNRDNRGCQSKSHWMSTTSPATLRKYFIRPFFRNKSKLDRKSAFTELFRPSRPPTRCSQSAFTPCWHQPPCGLPPAHQNSGGLADPILSVSVLQAVGVFSFLKESWIEFHRAAEEENVGPGWPLHLLNPLKWNQRLFQLKSE